VKVALCIELASIREPIRVDVLEGLHERPCVAALEPVLLAPTSISTGLIFHPMHIGAQEGWRLALIASPRSVFALVSFVRMRAAGPLCLVASLVAAAAPERGDG
jgi:hypothetical protein